MAIDRNDERRRDDERAKKDTNKDEVRIPVVEEQLNVGKRVVEHGGVRVSSEVEEKPVEKNIELHDEHVEVYRRPVDRPTELNLEDARQGAVEVHEREEVPVANKEARVVEEVVIAKEARDHTETVRDTVRRTNVDVEQIDEQSRRAAQPRTKAAAPRGSVDTAREQPDYGRIPSDLARLENLDDYEVADDDVDPRGWTLYGRGNDEIGEIKDLVVSPSTRKVYFAIVETDDKMLEVPVSRIQLDRDDEEAHSQFTRESIQNAPMYRDGARNYNEHARYWGGVR